MAWTEIINGDSSFLIPLFLLTILQSKPRGAEGQPLCSPAISALDFALRDREGWKEPLRMERPFIATMEDQSSWVYCCLSHLLVLNFWGLVLPSPLEMGFVSTMNLSLWGHGGVRLQGDLFPSRAPPLLLLISTALLFSLSFLQFFRGPLRSVQSLPTGHGAFLNYTKLNPFRWEWILGCLQ